ncbi:MAG: triose-phosphate isomerase [Planctomycetota bacterium]|nr:MAG: triose-phosphate isomerase [Planctomycetota bacterium]
MRKPLIAGNWKMNLDLPQARALIQGLRGGLEAAGEQIKAVEVAVCPSFIYLFPVAKAIDGSGIRLGAQDLYYEPNGAFTGEVSAAMVAETGARYVIIGHSERRHTIGHLEDDWMINRKLKAASAAGLTPILCVGETLAERDADRTLEALSFQVTAGLNEAEIEDASELVVAYEPVWAIGTGRNATPQQAQEAHAHIRKTMRNVIGPLADDVRVLYGGSLKPDNAKEILSQPDVDGGLVGGASLKPDSFLGIIEAALATVG